MAIHEIRFKKAIKEIRERVNCQYLDLIPITEGMNSKIYKISTKEDGIEIKMALKFFGDYDQNKRTFRARRESQFLRYAEKLKISNVPKIILENKREEWILLSWIEGEKINEMREEEIDAITSFIQKLNFQKDNFNIK